MGKLNKEEREAARIAAEKVMKFPWGSAGCEITWSVIYRALVNLSEGADVNINERLQSVLVCAKDVEASYGARIITRSGQYYRALGRGVTSNVNEAHIHPLEDAVHHAANKPLRLEVIKGGEVQKGSELEQLHDRLTALENG